MIVMAGINTGTQLVNLREINFLKQFTYVTRDYRIIFFAQMMTQYIVLFVTTFIIVVTSSLVFKVAFFKLLIVAYGMIVITALPVSFFFLVFTVFRIQIETLQTIVAILTTGLLLMMNFIDLGSSSPMILIMVNPILYVFEVGKLLLLYVVGVSLPFNVLSLFVTTLVYSLIGVLSIRYAKLMPIYRA